MRPGLGDLSQASMRDEEAAICIDEEAGLVPFHR